MIYKLFFSKYDTEKALRLHQNSALALGFERPYTEYKEINAASLEEAISIFQAKYADELADSINGKNLYIARLLDNGSIEIFP